MSVKIIGLGNTLMKDDGIGIEVLEQIEKSFNADILHKNFEFIYGETDISYCINSVVSEDQLFIIDASYLKKTPGDITTIAINSLDTNRKVYSQHSYNFLDLLKLYYPKVTGYIYAIEIYEIGYGIGISDVLRSKFKDIADNVSNNILRCISEGSKDN
ncbi:hydrogenase maturation protease [Anaeromicropila herbilytica]|uniref:HybD peptidase n=1 Tax=Anaeromicropila herbilytica TaxID=2785025 RepID=A0A7R7ICZ1_9FIRM|nr:hydrogenase maturation protease [Anaeromicropila herbilytica]BCN31248.1 HybD peptidase [Anaeromicropila herbilytica]